MDCGHSSSNTSSNNSTNDSPGTNHTQPGYTQRHHDTQYHQNTYAATTRSPTLVPRIQRGGDVKEFRLMSPRRKVGKPLGNTIHIDEGFVAAVSGPHNDDDTVTEYLGASKIDILSTSESEGRKKEIEALLMKEKLKLTLADANSDPVRPETDVSKSLNDRNAKKNCEKSDFDEKTEILQSNILDSLRNSCMSDAATNNSVLVSEKGNIINDNKKKTVSAEPEDTKKNSENTMDYSKTMMKENEKTVEEISQHEELDANKLNSLPSENFENEFHEDPSLLRESFEDDPTESKKEGNVDSKNTEAFHQQSSSPKAIQKKNILVLGIDDTKVKRKNESLKEDQYSYEAADDALEDKGDSGGDEHSLATFSSIIWDEHFTMDINLPVPKKRKSYDGFRIIRLDQKKPKLPKLPSCSSHRNFEVPYFIYYEWKQLQYLDENRKNPRDDADRPAPFILVDRLIYEKPMEREVDILVNCDCTAKAGCGSECVNRQLRIECNDAICLIGSKACKNRRLTNRNWSELTIKQVDRKGWGLFVDEDVVKGDLIAEYVGEVIGAEECSRRLNDEYKGDKDFYMLTTSSQEVIDATRFGGKSRFTNHSCDPNCVVQKWNVDGLFRTAIIACKDMKAGSEVTIDYNFERFGGVVQKCYCGSENCRGVIGPKPSLKVKKKDEIDMEIPYDLEFEQSMNIRNLLFDSAGFLGYRFAEEAQQKRILLNRNMRRCQHAARAKLKRFLEQKQIKALFQQLDKKNSCRGSERNTHDLDD